MEIICSWILRRLGWDVLGQVEIKLERKEIVDLDGGFLKSGCLC